MALVTTVGKRRLEETNPSVYVAVLGEASVLQTSEMLESESPVGKKLHRWRRGSLLMHLWPYLAKDQHQKLSY